MLVSCAHFLNLYPYGKRVFQKKRDCGLPAFNYMSDTCLFFSHDLYH